MLFLIRAPDRFADKLEIPANIKIAEPKPELKREYDEDPGTFQTAIFSALQAPRNREDIVVGYIYAIEELHEKNPKLFRHYLSVNPDWRVFEERGYLFATRRWEIDHERMFKFYGTYMRIVGEPESNLESFQTRFTIGLSRQPFWFPNDSIVTVLESGESTSPKLTMANQMMQSHCVIHSKTLVVEVFEQSELPERRVTTASLDFVEAELRPLADKPSWETVQKILPIDSIQIGKSSFHLRNFSQRGIYESIIWANPGEPGKNLSKSF